MNITETSIIGEVVASDYHTAAVLKNHKIDFCCNGNRTIADVCLEKGLDPIILIDQLEESTKINHASKQDFNSWSLDFLADYIVNQHHHYVEQKIQEIKPYLSKIVQVHGSQHPELLSVQQLFEETSDELTRHMKKEEFILFPFIRKMVRAQDNRETLASPIFDSVQNPIAMMHHEHDAEGERFRKIAALTQDYTPPNDACNTYKVTLAMLKEFEEDLHLHIHLENNILFPKSIELEEQLRDNKN